MPTETNNHGHAPLPRGLRSATGGWLGRFWSEQDGAMSYLALAGALVMMVFGGIGIDMMHAELKRTKLQNTLDRAVLAAASLENEMEPAAVVSDYLRAMGLEDALVAVQADVGPNLREVSAEGHQTMPSNFLQLVGIDVLEAGGKATAVNGMVDIEISLVLDISGSMTGRKIAQLQQAAKTFVDTVLSPENGIPSATISLIPYNATVNMGQSLPDYIALDRQHDHSNCAVFADEDFDTTVLPADARLEQLGQFDPSSTDLVAGRADRHWCHDGDTAAILVHSDDPDALKARIDTLTAGGNTAIDLGVKWGAALLDPSTRDVVEAMTDDGLVSRKSKQHPTEYDDRTTLKFLVVMTDGQNTTQYDLRPGLKSAEAMTGIWANTKGTEDVADDDYSVRLDRQISGVTNNHFPAWAQAISNFVLYFDTNGDGAWDAAHKVEDMPDNAPRDLDDLVAGAVAYAIAQDDRLTDSSQFLGASIKGGIQTTQHFAVKNNANGVLPDPGPVQNEAGIPGPTWSYGQIDFAYWSAQSTDTSYYWTRFANDAANRYQGSIDGMSADAQQVVQLSYHDLFDRFGTRVAASLLLGQPYVDGLLDESRYQELRGPVVSIANGAAADQRLSRVCDSARDNGVTVYAIGVEAPVAGKAAMRTCASSDSHFFDVTGDELEETFSSIARIVSELRLTQ